MRLTRRDALAALAAAGVAVGGATVLGGSGDVDRGDSPETSPDDAALDDGEIGTLVAAAAILYPDAVGGIDEFVSTYASGRATDRPEHAEGLRESLDYLDAYADAWHDAAFADLERETREEALRSMSADTADPDPGGSDAERVRYYVVNDLLFALYASPTGGELVGIENPQGHPGGLESYRRGPGDRAGDS